MAWYSYVTDIMLTQTGVKEMTERSDPDLSEH